MGRTEIEQNQCSSSSASVKSSGHLLIEGKVQSRERTEGSERGVVTLPNQASQMRLIEPYSTHRQGLVEPKQALRAGDHAKGIQAPEIRVFLGGRERERERDKEQPPRPPPPRAHPA